MTRRFVYALVAIAITASAVAHGAPLSLGGEAPPLGDSVSWVKGDPIPDWQDGHIYVLDFWATWCTPCIKSIPTLAKIQKKFAPDDVHIVSIAIWPSPGMVPTDVFVKKQGDKMPFAVADAIGDTVVNNFMVPTGQNGIPTTMIVNREGRLVYIGHPMSPAFADVLAGVVSGEFTAASAKALAANEERAEKLFAQANAAATTGNWDAAFSLMDEIIAIDPDAYADLAVVKFQRLLLTLGRYDEGYAFGDQIVKTIIAEKPYLLELLARFILEAPGLEPRDTDLAMRAINRAVALVGRSDEGVLATYASVLLARGETETAIDSIQDAFAIATDKQSPLLAEITRKRDEMLASAKGANEGN